MAFVAGMRGVVFGVMVCYNPNMTPDFVSPRKPMPPRTHLRQSDPAEEEKPLLSYWQTMSRFMRGVILVAGFMAAVAGLGSGSVYVFKAGTQYAVEKVRLMIFAEGQNPAIMQQSIDVIGKKVDKLADVSAQNSENILKLYQILAARMVSGATPVPLSPPK